MTIIGDHKVTIQRPIQDVWTKLIAVDDWPSWDKSLEKSTLKGEFKEGAEGSLKPKGAPFATAFKINNFVGNSRFDVVSSALWASVVFEHHLKSVGTSTELRHTIKMEGSVIGPISWLIGGGMKEALAPSMEAFKLQIEANSAPAAKSSSDDNSASAPIKRNSETGERLQLKERRIDDSK